jgi:hypothetical protein
MEEVEVIKQHVLGMLRSMQVAGTKTARASRSANRPAV